MEGQPKMNTIPMSLRKKNSEMAYGVAKQEGKLVALLEEERLFEFEHWIIVANRFPYDIALKKHHLLLPKRAVPAQGDLNPEELIELSRIMEQVQHNYDFILSNFPRKQSIKTHFHLHLGVYYDNREEMAL